MKRKNLILLLICFLFINFIDAQTASLKGRVSIINSKNSEGDIEYVKDALISSSHSSEVKSDYKGRFLLQIDGHQPQESIGLKAEKSGYEVVNKDDLEFAMADKNYTFRIFFAEEGYLEKRKSELLKVASKFISTNKDEMLDSIAFGGLNSQHAINNLAKRSGKKVYDAFEAEELLLQMNELLSKQLPKHIAKLASVNLDYASKQYRAAFKLYEQGKIKETVKFIDERRLDKAVKYVEKVLSEVVEDSNKSYKLISIRMNTLDQIKNTYALKIIALQQTFEFERAEIALEKLTEITKISPMAKDYILLESLKMGDYQSVEPVYVNSVLEEEESNSTNTTNSTIDDKVVKEKTEIVTNDVLTEKGKPISKMEKEDNTEKFFAEKINDLEAKKNITTITQAGEEEPKIIEGMLPIETSKSVSEANISDFENTLFIAEKPKDQLISILKRERSGGVSYSEKQPIVVSGEVTKPTIESYTSPASAAPVQRYVEPTYTPVAAKPVVIDKSNYISLDEIKVMKAEKKKVVRKKPVKTKTVRKVITKRTSLRKSATASSKVLKRLAVGTEVKVIEKVNRYWSRVIMNGREGYVKSFLLE